MKLSALMMPLCLAACASVSGSQSFETSAKYTLPAVGTVTGTRTITAQAAADTRAFAASVLKDIDELRDDKHVDSADAKLRIVSATLAVDTSFAGVQSVRIQLVTASSTVELCDRALSSSDQQASTVSCSTDHVFDETDLTTASSSTASSRIDIQLVVSGTVTARHLTSTVGFEVEVNADVSL